MEDFSFQKKKNFYFLRKRTVFEIFIFVSLLELIFVLFIFDIIPLRNFWASVMPNVLIDLANNFRSENNLNKLTPSPLLEEAARLKAEDMAKKGYFAHTSPEGIDPWYWFEKVGYDFVYAGENLAVNFYDSKTLHQAWLESPKHKKNIVNKNFTEIGIATAKGVYKGKEAVFVVQLFGKPRSKLSYTPGVVIRDKEKEPLSKPPNSVEGEVKSAEFLPPEIVKEENSAQIGGETEEELSKKEDFIETKKEIFYSSIFARIFSSPKSVVNFFLLALILIFLSSLFVKIFIVKKEILFPNLLLNGLIIFAIVLSALYFNHWLISFLGKVP